MTPKFIVQDRIKDRGTAFKKGAIHGAIALCTFVDARCNKSVVVTSVLMSFTLLGTILGKLESLDAFFCWKPFSSVTLC